MQNALPAVPTVMVSYSILIQNWRKMIYWLACILLWLFFYYSKLIQDVLLAALPPPVLFFLNSNSIQNALLAALHPRVLVSYSIVIQN